MTEMLAISGMSSILGISEILGRTSSVTPFWKFEISDSQIHYSGRVGVGERERERERGCISAIQWLLNNMHNSNKASIKIRC